ncbi:hypothetical protein GOV11_02655 [Candidatus Woesearchaeota archaeon]|nr:hypothetical protein [Candidatus Woesearchaeota archaeon]
MKKFILGIFIVLLILPMISADIGPKPTVELRVTNNDTSLEGEFHARLFKCGDAPKDLLDAANCENKGISMEDCERFAFTIPDESDCEWYPDKWTWNRPCKNSTCHFNYHPPTYFRAVILYEDELYVLPPTENQAFNSIFEFDLGDNSTINEITPSITEQNRSHITKSLILTLIIELVIAFIWVRRNWRVIGTVAAINVVTLPLLHIFGGSFWFIFELPIIAVEALALRFLGKMSWRDSFFLSFVMNFVSLIIGLIWIFTGRF